MTTSTAQHEKNSYRARFDAYRRSLSADTHAVCSAAIVERIEALPAYRSARCIHAYWPMVHRGEIDIRPLLLAGHRAGKQILLPAVTSSQGAVMTPRMTPRMTHRLFEGEDRLQPGPWGVHEPMEGKTVPDKAIDLVLTPALGADLLGFRLGYGKGYYDSFLAGLGATVVCPVFDACVVDLLPHEPHDIPVSYLATESRLLRVLE
ncbi:MAG: 5-formyltetrahydrofolate cyclo-ligase [Rhodothermales bacterium]|nr:5-formyltetrahydrofolate cyclo-ligase [Rhodothermales bacterium]